MNKTLIYILIAVLAGLGLGFLFFHDSDASESTDHGQHAVESEETMWTCSMHPQIMREEFGDCPICGMDLIPAASQATGLAANQFRMTDNALALANIQTSMVGMAQDSLGDTLTISGSIAVNEDATATQPAHFDGRIESLAVNFLGQEIKKGQQVATVYSPALVAAQQELLTTSKLKQSQPQLYQAVRRKFKNWQIADALLDRVERTGEVITRFPIYAQVAGVVSQISVNEGAHVEDGMPIFKVSDLNEVWAEFDAYERQLGQLKLGQELHIAVNAYPEKDFKGTVSFIDPVLNAASRTVTVRATLPNDDALLKPGMFVTAQIKGEPSMPESQLSIPASAVMWTGERSLVYLQPNPDQPVFQMREVVLGIKLGESYAVVKGLTAGDHIVTHGTFTVDAAAQLGGKASMMNSAKRTDQDFVGENAIPRLSEELQQELKKLLPQYLKLKDAFYASDASSVSAEAKKMSQNLQASERGDLDVSFKNSVSTILQQLNALEGSSAIEEQRKIFVRLNENLVPIYRTVSDFGYSVYVQRCPMANNSKGAIWLSGQSKIENPYYGEEMPNCGSVVDTLR